MRRIIKLYLDDATVKKLENLAAEDGVSVDSFIEKVVQLEDSRRHIHTNRFLYGLGERRFKCGSSVCKELEEKPEQRYEE